MHSDALGGGGTDVKTGVIEVVIIEGTDIVGLDILYKK